jgi:hypothetical protein
VQEDPNRYPQQGWGFKESRELGRIAGASPADLHPSSARSGHHYPESDERIDDRRIAFDKCSHPISNSHSHCLVEHTVNNFRLAPGNIVSAAPKILAGRRADNFMRKQCNQLWNEW